MGTPSQTIVHHAEAGHAIGQLGPAYVLVFRREVRAEDFIRFSWLTKRAQQPFIGFSVMSEEAPPGLSKPAREALIEIYEQEELIVASAVVIRGTSLRTTIVRSMLSAVMLVARSRKPYRVFAQVDEAASFVSGVHGREELAAPMVAFVEELFAAADAC